jgi:hypothetical protein
VLRKIDRIAVVIVSGAVGLNAIIPGWQIMTSGTVYGFKLPSTWLTAYWPFGDFFLAGLLLLVVVGGGCLATAVVNIRSQEQGAMAALIMGGVLVGWIVGELVFMNQTMIMTWIVLGSGVVLIALSAPYALPALAAFVDRRHRPQTAGIGIRSRS